MSEAPFTKVISDALDHFTVPPLPDGFADRLVARAEAESNAALPALRPRRSLGGRWQRSAFIAGSVGLFGMVTAAAAATGFFGEPVYVPVVSEALANANIAPMPKMASVKPPKAKAAPAAKPATAAIETPPTQMAEAKATGGTEQARATIREMWQDPAFRQLPLEKRRLAARERLRTGIAEGRYSKDELKAAMQAMQAERAERREQRKAARAAFGLPEKPKQQPAGQMQRAAPANPNADGSAPAARQKLRERLQNATPEERERILAKMRERREARRAAREAGNQAEIPTDKPLQSPTTQVVAEPPK